MDGNAESMARTMMDTAGLSEDEGITFEKFKKIVLVPGSIFRKVCLHIGGGVRPLSRTFSFENIGPIREHFEGETGDGKEDVADSALSQWYNGWINEIWSKIQYVFWLVLYTIVMFLIFAERAYFFS